MYTVNTIKCYKGMKEYDSPLSGLYQKKFFTLKGAMKFLDDKAEGMGAVIDSERHIAYAGSPYPMNGFMEAREQQKECESCPGRCHTFITEHFGKQYYKALKYIAYVLESNDINARVGMDKHGLYVYIKDSYPDEYDDTMFQVIFEDVDLDSPKYNLFPFGAEDYMDVLFETKFNADAVMKARKILKQTKLYDICAED